MQDNSVYLEVMMLAQDNCIYYNNVTYGKQVWLKKSKAIDSKGKTIGWRDIDLSNIKNNYFIIVTNMEEITNQKNAVIFDWNSYSTQNETKKCEGSSMVILCMCCQEKKY